METGRVIGGFRVERLLGRGSLGSVYEATQLSLGRTVALRLLEADAFPDADDYGRFLGRQRLSATVHHPNIVPTYEAGEWEGGSFVATRYVRGRTLADLLAGGELPPARLRALLEPIGGALDVAHRAGLVHGRITAENVLVDAAGTSYLADLGLGHPGSVESDRAALAALLAEAERGGRRGRRATNAAPAVLALAAAVAVAGALALGGGDDAGGEPAPPLPEGTVSLGSELEPGPVRSIGCEDEPDPNTPACTLSQASVARRAVTVREDGVLRGWAVRGAGGDLALQVIGRRGGHAFLRGFSQVEQVPDPGPHTFAANVRVKRGDRIGVLLAPGAAIGGRVAPADASALRWEGSLDFVPHPQSFVRLDAELLLRADVEPGARVELPQITARQAATAEAGAVLESETIDLPGGVVRVDLVRVGGGIAVDALRGRRRLARVDIPDAEPGGRLLELSAQCGYARGFCLRWLNPGDLAPLIHAYRLARDGRAFRLIG